MTESRLRRGWNPTRRRCWCDDGRISAAKALLTRSPSTVPILTREFVIADLRAFSLLFGYDDVLLRPWLWLLTFLCKLHRNEPGCVVGEHMHVCFFRLCPAVDDDVDDVMGRPLRVFTEEIEQLGEKRRDCDDGEVGRWKKDLVAAAAAEEKVELEEAKAE